VASAKITSEKGCMTQILEQRQNPDLRRHAVDEGEQRQLPTGFVGCGSIIECCPVMLAWGILEVPQQCKLIVDVLFVTQLKALSRFSCING
jgi:hypothetical protein